MAGRPASPGRLDAAGIGVAVRDLTVALAEFPSPDTKVRAQAFAESGGGPVPTALVTMARLGDRAAFAGVVGHDAAGAFLLEDLRREGVDVRGVAVRGGLSSPTSVILVEKDGRRTVCEWRQDDLPLAPSDLAPFEPALERCRLLLVDARLPDAQIDAARRVRARGAIVMIDCGHPRPGVEALLPLCDVAVLSQSYPRSLLGTGFDPRAFVEEMSRSLAAEGLRIAGLTLGPEGCLISAAGGAPVRIEGIRIQAVDTTGAGDVFHGALAHALLGGADSIDAARFANAAAAAKCLGLTGRAPLPPDAEIRRLAGLPSL